MARICFVLESAHLAFTGERMIGGAEIQIRTVGERFADLGHEVWVASGHRFEHPRIGSLTTGGLWRGLRSLGLSEAKTNNGTITVRDQYETFSK